MDDRFRQDIEAVGRIAAVPKILDVVCRTTGMGFAAVARVTDAHWVTCQALDHIGFGLKPGDELKVETTICNEIRSSLQALVIGHVSEDATYCSHPTAAMYGIESYISIPIIRANGDFFGTLCAIDPRPARLDNLETMGMLKLFAELVASHLDADQKLAEAEANLLGERRMAELREQFIAVLGHDLRNPVASIDSGMKLLLRQPLDERSHQVVTLVRGSVLRMRGLIDNVLDFARGRLGDGLTLDRSEDGGLATSLMQVVDEMRIAHPDRAIKATIAIHRPVLCDRARLGQLLSNLLGNALTHGSSDQPIEMRAATEHDRFVLSVANAGNPIGEETMKHLFHPFLRGEVRASQQGLGLGLFITSEIAKAHGGTMSVVSDEQETRITFEMPLDGAPSKPAS
ncbi:GAF domain-containing sensor histidine kinase [Aurantimonas sp. 22II-16-19i]|uniref:GAF domain-containing sensor histidine kinase n=1 Tax=Aurantimonas sp. 22II-16-19i TaxID=1317114 RepID=UPI0009F7B3D6|nr:GAF domain-containing sensor histidine kinase [Aurantimonas sp. 22II-16-19i]ORE94775.1 ATPase [Aurantimonas sp. 22II-16-19i]